MKWAPFSAGFSFVLICGIASTVAAQSKPSHGPVRRAVRVEQGIASAAVHIALTTMSAGGTSIEIGSDRWSARGYDLRGLISQIYAIDSRRVDFAGFEDGSADARYDLTLSLARDVDEDTMQQLLINALEKKFQLSIRSESRSMDVYVLTAPTGAGSALHLHAAGVSGRTRPRTGDTQDSGPEDAQQITYEGRECSGKTSANGITASADTISEFRRTLEPQLDRLLVDETNLGGSYDFKIGNYANQRELFELMHAELGIVVTPMQRSVTLLTVRPAQEMRAAM